MTNFVHVLVQKLPFSNGFFSSNVHIRERSFWGATNWRAGTAIVHFGERCSFWGATNRMAVTAIVHFGEHCSFRGATNKSAVTAPLNEQKNYCEIYRYVGKVFWEKNSAQLAFPVRSTFQNDLHPIKGGPHRTAN